VSSRISACSCFALYSPCIHAVISCATSRLDGLLCSTSPVSSIHLARRRLRFSYDGRKWPTLLDLKANKHYKHLALERSFDCNSLVNSSADAQRDCRSNRLYVLQSFCSAQHRKTTDVLNTDEQVPVRYHYVITPSASWPQTCYQ
jgi:hypothetical protein